MNPAIYIGTQAKYRLAIKILFLGDKRNRRDSRRSSASVPGQEGGAKFYVRQMSSSNEAQEVEIQETSLNKKEILGGRKLKRQVSFQ